MSALMLAVICAGLMALGAGIAVGKILYRDESIRSRKSIGVIILGAATSLVAGILTIKFDDLSPLSIIGMGAALGLLGAKAIEATLKKCAEKFL